MRSNHARTARRSEYGLQLGDEPLGGAQRPFHREVYGHQTSHERESFDSSDENGDFCDGAASTRFDVAWAVAVVSATRDLKGEADIGCGGSYVAGGAVRSRPPRKARSIRFSVRRKVVSSPPEHMNAIGAAVLPRGGPPSNHAAVTRCRCRLWRGCVRSREWL